MRYHKARIGGALSAFALVLSACSGDADDAAADQAANAPIEQIDAGSGGVVSGPITGLLTVQPSFGFGVYAVDPTTGQAAAVPGIAAVETVDRNRDLLVSGGSAYALGAKTRDGQTFAADISVARIDYATGRVTLLAPLGFDRETDASETTITHTLEAVAGDKVVVSSQDFGSGETRFRVFDATSGDEKSSFPRPAYSFSSDSGSCSGGISDLVGLSDGRLAGVSLGSPAIVDLDDGAIELLVACDTDGPQLSTFVPRGAIADYAVFNEGPAPSPEQLQRLLMTDLEPPWGFVEGNGDLWWIVAAVRTVDEVDAVVGGVVQFDLADQQIEAVHPLGVHLGGYAECAADTTQCQVTTLAQAQLRWSRDRLVILDGGENGRVLTLEPRTSTLTVTELALGDGVDYTTADLLAGDPLGVWLEVRRMTVVSDDASGRTASGPAYIERLNPTTGLIDVSLASEEIFF